VRVGLDYTFGAFGKDGLAIYAVIAASGCAIVTPGGGGPSATAGRAAKKPKSDA